MERNRREPRLKLKNLGINTYHQPIIYMREDCHICQAEGFEAHARVKVSLKGKFLIATLNIVTSDILQHGEASLSEYAQSFLGAQDGDEITISHPQTLDSLSYLRAKIYGNELQGPHFQSIINDIVGGYYSDIHVSSFLTACAAGGLSEREIIHLTHAMVTSGETLDWGMDLVVDKHCVGGLPGNRTTPIVVAIVTAFGLTMPKTSSRAITSPAGTADTMEVLVPVNLDINTMRKVVRSEGGCIAWGGSVSISPADDLLIRVEKALDLDCAGQLVASILSKKIAAGSSHILIDIPVGDTAKIRSASMAAELSQHLYNVALALGVQVSICTSDGTQPVGRGIGPALEARDLLSVLQNKSDAPQDLRERSLELAGRILEFSPDVQVGTGVNLAKNILDSGKAWSKFQAICDAQGGMREIPKAPYTHSVKSTKAGIVAAIDNRNIARVAKLAGAPASKVAGIDFFAPIGTQISVGQPLFTIHSNSPGELEYALSYLQTIHQMIDIREEV